MGERREEEGESGDSVLIIIMPRLQILDIRGCPKLKALPNFLETTSLKELSVDFSNFQLDDVGNIIWIENTSSLSE